QELPHVECLVTHQPAVLRGNLAGAVLEAPRRVCKNGSKFLALDLLQQIFARRHPFALYWCAVMPIASIGHPPPPPPSMRGSSLDIHVVDLPYFFQISPPK